MEKYLLYILCIFFLLVYRVQVCSRQAYLQVRSLLMYVKKLYGMHNVLMTYFSCLRTIPESEMASRPTDSSDRQLEHQGQFQGE